MNKGKGTVKLRRQASRQPFRDLYTQPGARHGMSAVVARASANAAWFLQIEHLHGLSLNDVGHSRKHRMVMADRRASERRKTPVVIRHSPRCRAKSPARESALAHPLSRVP